MRRLTLLFGLVLLLGIAPRPGFGQSTADHVEAGKSALREDRPADAARAFEAAVKADPENAEAYFLLARVYAETSIADRRRAEDALERALELEPENLQFLVARLQMLREESWNFFVERIRESRRVALARQILALDSTNAFAHEELGTSFIRDFWRYRNAVMLPTLRQGQPAYLDRQDEAQLDPFDAMEASTLDPEQVFRLERYDVERLEQQGVPVVDLSRRARRAYERAIDHLEKALESDPRRRSVYDRLMEIYALRGEYAEALDMLAEMHTFLPEEADTWLYLGLANLRAGRMDAADESFGRAFDYMTEEERDAFTSLDHLLPEEHRNAYRDDPVAYVARFWTSKDPRYLTVYNERRLEHYARLVYADLLYGARDLGLRGWDTERGRILVRYGVPQRDVVVMPSAAPVPGDDLSGPTRADRGGPDYAGLEPQEGEVPLDNRRRMPAWDRDGFDAAADANTFNVWDYGDFRFVFEDPLRSGEYRLYSPSASEINQGVNPWVNDYAIRAKEIFRETPERYEYRAPGRQVEMPFLVNAFKGADGAADLYVHFGLVITDVPEADVIDLTANLGAFLIGPDYDLLAERRRTIYGLRTAQIVSFDEANLWVHSQQLAAPAGRHQVSMEFETASGGTVAVQRRAVDVPDFPAGRLTLSDVMLAYHVEEASGEQADDGAAIHRRGLAIRPAPWSVFSTEQPIYLYFETYGLTPGDDGRTDFEVEALLVPEDDARGVAGVWRKLFGGDRGVSVALPGSGTSADEGQYLIMDATDQAPGLYRLVLRVRDNVAGRTVEREAELFLE